MKLRAIITLFSLWLVAFPLAAAGLGWQVTDADGNRLYVVGTVHAATEDIYPLPAPITDALAASEVLVLEVDPRTLNPLEMQRLVREYGILPNREGLRELLPKETWERVVAWGERVSLSAGQLNRMRPWLATTTLVAVQLAAIGVDRQFGMEPWLVGRAIERDMAILQLESATEQIAMLAGLSHDAQLAFLESSLTELEEFEESVNTLLDNWKEGDVEAMTELLAETYLEQQDLYVAMISARNQRWMERLRGMLASGKVHYVAVGALHLVGPDGLVTMLEAEGYTVERL